MNYYDERDLAGLIKPTTMKDKPINPKTGRPYTKNSKKYWIWYWGLSIEDRNIMADLEAF